MQSCEYTYVEKGERKTRQIRVCNVVFRHGARAISYDNPYLHLAHTVSIDFGDQKSEIKNETVSQDNNWKDELNPVKHYVNTIR